MTLSIINNQALDENGRPYARTVAAQAGATMYYSGPSFLTAQLNSVVWDKRIAVPPFTKTARNWATVSMFKPDGTTTTVETEAGMTVIDILITKNFELIGGALAIPNVLPDGNLDQEWRIWVYAVPDVTEELGGSVPFVESLLIKDFYEGEDVVIDGRSTKMLTYAEAGAPGSGMWLNKLRFLIQHPTGLNPTVTAAHRAKFQIILDAFIKWV
jgi:hypothetical protein